MSDGSTFLEVLGSAGSNKYELIKVLQAAQNEFSYIPASAAEEISEKMNIPVSEIYGVITFYRQFTLIRPGKHIIKVCEGTACHVADSKRLSGYIADLLSVSPGETTADGLFTLSSVACLGCCSLAPAMMIDGFVYGRLDEVQIKEIIENIRKGEK